MKKGCRSFASALLLAVTIGVSMPSPGLAYSYIGKSYQYANNLDKANQKVEASKNKLHGITTTSGGTSASSAVASTSYVDMILNNDSDSEELIDPKDVFKDITFGGKSILNQNESNAKKIKPFNVKTGRLKATLKTGYKLKKIEIGTLDVNKKGEEEMVYKTVTNGVQVTLSERLSEDDTLEYAPTEIVITFYSTSTKKNSEYVITLFRKVE